MILNFTIFPFTQICTEVQDASKGWTVKYDQHGEVPYTYKGTQWVGYENPASLQIKMNFIKARGYAGAMVWAIDMDDFHGLCGPENALIEVLYDNMKDYVVPEPNVVTTPTPEWARPPSTEPSKDDRPVVSEETTRRPTSKRPSSKKPGSRKPTRTTVATTEATTEKTTPRPATTKKPEVEVQKPVDMPVTQASVDVTTKKKKKRRKKTTTVTLSTTTTEASTTASSTTPAKEEDNDDEEIVEEGQQSPSLDEIQPEVGKPDCAGKKSDETVFFADETDCSMFWQCNHERPVSFTCKDGLVFNPQEQVCDWPENSIREQCKKLKKPVPEVDAENEVVE